MKKLIEVDFDDFEGLRAHLDEFENSSPWIQDDPTGCWCYHSVLTDTHNIPNDYVADVLNLAMEQEFYSTCTGVLQVSVNNAEPNHKEFLEQAKNYPGAQIMEIPRGDNHIVYLLTFPARPEL